MPFSYSGLPISMNPPTPVEPFDEARVDEQAFRFRVLTGQWEGDAEIKLRYFFDDEQTSIMPAVDISRNPALMVVGQISTLYDHAPKVSTPEASAELGEDEVLDLAPISTPQLWALSQERHRLVVGINESLMRVDWQTDMVDEAGAETSGHISYRGVPPSLIQHAEADPAFPDRPVYIEELRIGRHTDEDGGTRNGWVVEVWDLRDPTEPKRFDRFREINGTTVVDGPLMEWPYVDEAGTPIFPYVLYHRRVTNQLWNPARGKELFWASLNTSSLNTFWLFGVRDSSFPQRWHLDCEPVGVKVKAADIGTSTRVVTSSPTTSVHFRSTGDGSTSGTIGQWAVAMDPEATGRAIEQYMAGAAMYAGVSPSDITLGSSNQSGYSIVVSRDGQRKAQMRQEVSARFGDQTLLATAARIYNPRRPQGADPLPEETTAYLIQYAPIAESPQELAARVDTVEKLLERGLISPVEAYMRVHQGTTPEQAQAALDHNAKQRRLLSVAAQAPADRAAEINLLQSTRADIGDLEYFRGLQRLGIISAETDIEAMVRDLVREE